MQIRNILASIFTVALLSSCSVSTPIMVTNNPANVKTGTAEYSVILGIIKPMNADISIAKAAENGRITRVATVDFKVKGGFFKTTYITIVTGD